jgi:hypothetical protein
MMDIATGATRVVRMGGGKFLAQGFVTNDAWNWVPGKLLYLAANGTMTQTRPTSGPVTVLGIAYTSKKICLDPRPPKMALGFSPGNWDGTMTDFFTDDIADFFE